MNEPSNNKLVPLLALTAALIIPALLPQSAHGMYDPKHGRWLQRDPLGVRPGRRAVLRPANQYRDGMSLYQYVRGNPPRRVDPTGLLSPFPGGIPDNYPMAWPCIDCKKWVEDELKDTSWLDRLPNCPCTLAGVSGNGWGPVERAPPTHPRADKCVRSKQGCGQPGQQCCYDEWGRLTTRGPAAGTPDWRNPDCCWTDWFVHGTEDVIPFYYCPLDLYLQARPPNNGNNCADSDGSVPPPPPLPPIPPPPTDKEICTSEAQDVFDGCMASGGTVEKCTGKADAAFERCMKEGPGAE